MTFGVCQRIHAGVILIAAAIKVSVLVSENKRYLKLNIVKRTHMFKQGNCYFVPATLSIYCYLFMARCQSVFIPLRNDQRRFTAIPHPTPQPAAPSRCLSQRSLIVNGLANRRAALRIRSHSSLVGELRKHGCYYSQS